LASEEDAVDFGAEVDDGFLLADVVMPDAVVVATEEPVVEPLPVGEARGAVDCPLIWF
jgi:hypothetical protein